MMFPNKKKYSLIFSCMNSVSLVRPPMSLIFTSFKKLQEMGNCRKTNLLNLMLWSEFRMLKALQGNLEESRYWPLVRGNHQSLVDSPHKGPVMQKAFSCVQLITLSYNEFGSSIFSCDQAALWMVFSVRLSVCPSVRLSVCLSVCPSVRLSVCPSVRLSVCHTFLTMFPSSYHHEIFRSYHIGPG